MKIRGGKKMLKICWKRGMGKKGVLEFMMTTAFRIAVMMVALLAFILLINYYVTNSVDSNLLQAETLTNRILYSDAIMYTDPYTFRVYPGIVDIQKLNDTHIESSINYTYTRHVAVKMKLLNKNDDPKTQFITEAYINRKQFEEWKILLNGLPGGKGSVTMYINDYPVTYISANNRYDYGTLVIEVMVPNS
jgi:hypothetical protein